MAIPLSYIIPLSSPSALRRCARGLPRYFHTLPFLLWRTQLPTAARLALWAAIESVWNVFPSTPQSSALLAVCHVALLLALWRAPPAPPTAAAAGKRGTSSPGGGGGTSSPAGGGKRGTNSDATTDNSWVSLVLTGEVSPAGGAATPGRRSERLRARTARA